MTNKLYRPALAGILALVLPACATSNPPIDDKTSTEAVDLGPSTRAQGTKIVMAGHEPHRAPHSVLTVRESRSDAPRSDAQAVGTVNTVDPVRHTLNLSHEPIATLGWPAMTMDFAVAPSVDLKRLKPGSRVGFSLERDKAGMYQIQSVDPVGTPR